MNDITKASLIYGAVEAAQVLKTLNGASVTPELLALLLTKAYTAGLVVGLRQLAAREGEMR